MGIEIHGFNFLKKLADDRTLGDVLTIGRQSLSIPQQHIINAIGYPVPITDGYCEPLLIAMGANSVSSVDYSDYEVPTYVADLNTAVDLKGNFDTIVDCDSLEHIFDQASAFRNCINFCKIGGRIIHILPVNNLSGHGFWQFNSDLMFSIYSQENQFINTRIYYASSIDFSSWYEVTIASPNTRTEVASVEPIILLCVTEKSAEVHSLKVTQPFYEKAWDDHDASQLNLPPNVIMRIARVLIRKRGKFINLLRNIFFVTGLLTGRSRFSIRRFKRVPIRINLTEKNQ